jgi:8-amino-7-oxononanoate synthase
LNRWTTRPKKADDTTVAGQRFEPRQTFHVKQSSSSLAFLEPKLDRLRSRGELRDDRPVLVPEPFGRNDVLAFADTDLGAGGSGGSRLLGGDSEEHQALEADLASWLEVPATLAFSTGYAANVGALSALLERDDVVVSDERNHASLIDGIRLSKARPVVVPHNDLSAIDDALASAGGRRSWVVTESYFSMDADGPDVGALRQICDRRDATLVLDEAHALGVFGARGRGRAAEAGVHPDVLLGMFGKAFAGAGAFAAGDASLRRWLWNRARSFVFSTAPPSALVRSLRATLPRVIGADARRRQAFASADRLRRGLRDLGARVIGFGPVVPVVIGSSEDAVDCAARMSALGIPTRPVRPPTVAPGTARIRLVVNAGHTFDMIDDTLDRLGKLPWDRWS